jgi:hypothetical protein
MNVGLHGTCVMSEEVPEKKKGWINSKCEICYVCKHFFPMLVKEFGYKKEQ